MKTQEGLIGVIKRSQLGTSLQVYYNKLAVHL